MKKYIGFIKYCIVGASSMFIDIGVLFALVEYGKLTVLPAATISFIISTINGYILNRTWTFQVQKGENHSQYFKFLFIATVGLGINLLCMYLFTEKMHLWYIIAKVLSSAIVLLWSFQANTRWTFAKKDPQ